MLTLQYAKDTWSIGTVMTVDDIGNGRSWICPHVREAEFMFPTEWVGGIWPTALWGYNLGHMMSPTEERIEIDRLEWALDRDWLNACTLHVHVARDFPGLFGHRGSHISLEMGNFNGFSGQYHRYKLDVRSDITMLVIDDKEVTRMPTPVERLVRSYMIFSLAYDAARGLADQSKKYLMHIRAILGPPNRSASRDHLRYAIS